MQRLMRGKNHHPLLSQMFCNQFLYQCHCSDIKRSQRFVEYPQFGIADQQTRQRNTPPLALRKHFGRQHFPAAQAHTPQSGHRLFFFEFNPRKSCRNAQVFQRAQLILDCIQMPEIQYLGIVILSQLADSLTAPDNLTLIRHQEAAQGTQQTGFSAAVSALHLHDLPEMQMKIQPGKQTMVASTTSKIADFQHEGET